VKTKPRLTPGQRAQFEVLGLDPAQVGRIVNKAAIQPKKLPMPKNTEELEEFLNDTDKAKHVLASTDKLIEFMDGYAREQQGDGTELNQLIAAETQRQLVALMRDNDQKADKDTIRRLNLDPQSRPSGMNNSHMQATRYNPNAPGAIIDGEFDGFLDYFRTTWHKNGTAAAAEKLLRIKNAHSSVVPAEGGFLVPEILRAQLLQLALERSVVRPRATVVPMEVPRIGFPMIDSTSNASSVFGGMIGYWGEESAALAESNPKFGKVDLDAKKLTGFAVVPNELLSDSLISFTALLETLWPQALAFFEDVAFMSGSGAGEPLGFLGAANPAGIAVTKESGQAASTILVENIIKMYSRMLPASLNTAVWVVSPETIPELYTMAISVGTGGAPVMLVNAAGPGPATMLGRPIVISEKAGRLGTRSDVAFVDLAYYLIGDRQTMSADSSTDYRFGNDQTAFRILQRVDGRPWLQSAITPRNGGPSLSPFVEIETRA